MSIYNTTVLAQISEEINFNALLNAYCREFSNWSRYQGVPQYDAALATYFKNTGHQLHLRFDFSSQGVEVFAPLQFYADSGRHLFYFPVVERCLNNDEIKKISAQQFMQRAMQYAEDKLPAAQIEWVNQRLGNSISNLTHFLQFFNVNGKAINAPKINFIQAEQSLILGHHAHPLPKGRLGFKNDETLFKYSPETQGKFKLAYFLINNENINEQNAEGFEITDDFKLSLMADAPADVRRLVDENPQFKVVPMHPWEADYLLQQTEVKAMQAEKSLYFLGFFGAEYTPTSSVRTVYHAESKWMLKFSLHVKITNSERVNLLRELYRGYDISKLLKTEFGKAARADYPEIDFITDPAFISISHQGKVIDGFNISIRHNPFRGDGLEKNVSLVAALCQDGFLGQKARIVNVITEAAQHSHKSIEKTALNWFKQYLHCCVKPLIGLYNKYGMVFEFHQQNVLLELDSQYFPAKFYFRDNQGFFFRAGMADTLSQVLPGLATESGAIVPEALINPKFNYYLLINHILGVVNALACNGLAPERELINLTYLEFKQFEEMDKTGLVDYILNSRNWEVKGNLLTNVYGIDEASAPIENPAIYRQMPNPLHQYFFVKDLIKPDTKSYLYERYFPKEEVTIKIRPFDINRDLEMVHHWFNQAHTKSIWKMDGPIRNLELFYRTLLPGDVSHSFIGETNGIPTFTMEPYWPMRDAVGAYYDALPTDYGTHLLIAPADKAKKYSHSTGQAVLDFLFAHATVGKVIGEAAVESRAMHIFATRLGYKFQRVINMPHKNANLTYCFREWYFEKFPEAETYFLAKNEVLNEEVIS